MRDADKPFVLYRRGPMNFTIVPRGVKGWVQLVIWMALLVPPLLWLNDYAAAYGEERALYPGLAAFMGMVLVWSLGGIAWMRPRAEVVDVDELLKLKREAERRRDRR